jgi:hypothetical protein
VLIRAVIICNSLSAVGALLGIAVLIGKRSPYAFPAAVYPLVFPWLYYVTHPNLRYRHPIDPVILLLTSIAAASAWGVMTRKGRQNPPADTELAGGAG